jgi:hypothetical protein
MGEMRRATAREAQERRTQARFASTLVIAASIIAAVSVSSKPLNVRFYHGADNHRECVDVRNGKDTHQHKRADNAGRKLDLFAPRHSATVAVNLPENHCRIRHGIQSCPNNVARNMGDAQLMSVVLSNHTRLREIRLIVANEM